MSAYERVAVAAHPPDVVAALRAILHERGVVEYAVVDHGHDMARAGAAGFVAWTVLFGNPSAGAQLLARDLVAAVDIPLRLAVIPDADGGSEIVLRDMRELLGDEHGEIGDTFTAVLRRLAHAARERATA